MGTLLVGTIAPDASTKGGADDCYLNITPGTFFVNPDGARWVPSGALWKKAGDNVFYESGAVGVGTAPQDASLHVGGGRFRVTNGLRYALVAPGEYDAGNGGQIKAVLPVDDSLYVACGPAGLAILDVEDGGALHVAARVAGTARGVCVGATVTHTSPLRLQRPAFVASGDDGIKAYDVLTTAAVSPLGKGLALPHGGATGTIATFGNVVYAASGNALAVAQFDSTFAMTLRGSFAPGGISSSLLNFAIVPNDTRTIAYLGYPSALVAVDVSDPEGPKEIWRYAPKVPWLASPANPSAPDGAQWVIRNLASNGDRLFLA